MRPFLFLIASLFLAAAAAAQSPPAPLASGLAEETVEVKVNYSGAHVTLFVSAPDLPPGTGFVVALFGPPISQTIIANDPDRRRRAVFPTASAVFARAADPGFLSRLPPAALDAAGLGSQSASGPLQAAASPSEAARWRNAFMRLKQNEGLYVADIAEIDDLGSGLRRARIGLPSDAPPGDYRVRAAAFDKGRIIAMSDNRFTLVRSGLDETLFELATRHGVVYGFLGLVLAGVIGGAAAWAGRRR
jgi:hypothetical protein